jgi:hypothetical protein
MRSAPRILTLASLTLVGALAAIGGGLLAPTVGLADELKMTTAPEGSADRPARGMSMDKVEATFGAPTRRVPAIGEPPISRWEYPSFVVYFENQLVIHSVGVG